MTSMKRKQVEDEATNIGQIRAWDSRDHYFHVKEIKLRKQYADDAPREDDLFDGCTFHIDGYMPQITNLELKELIYKHGGAYEQYFSRSRVTHVIATNLPHSKIKEYSSMSESTRPHVVKPEWVLESIKSSALQDLKQYSLLAQTRQANLFSSISKDKNTNHNPQHHLQNAATDPNYVKNFLKNSRLHFIGSWKRKFLERNEYAIKKYKKAKQSGTPYFVVHIDMDCFFAAIAMRENPRLRDKPIAVSHSTGGNGDVSSANYVARKYGVKSGMWMAQARELCKDLIVVPYQFDKYEEAALKVYDVMKSLVEADSIEVSSIDEVYLYLYQKDANEVSDLVYNIRKLIDERTGGCTASAGISNCKLLARMATKKAKPNGQWLILQESPEVIPFMKSFKLRDIPGVGRKLNAKIEKELQITTIEGLHEIQKSRLQELFGEKRGEMLYHYSRGEETEEDYMSQDDIWSGKSRNIDINYGIRFDRVDQVNEFLVKICEEMSERLQLEKITARSLTLKIKKRRPGAAKDPIKFNGMGVVDGYTKSATFSEQTNKVSVMANHAKKLYEQLNIEPAELRGIGIQVNRLVKETVDKSTTRLSQFFAKAKGDEESNRDLQEANVTNQMNEVVYQQRVANSKASDLDVGINISDLPSMSQLDADVFESLPEDIKKELINAYAAQPKEPEANNLAAVQPKPASKKRKVAPGKDRSKESKQRKLLHYGTVQSKPDQHSTNLHENQITTQDVANGDFSQVNYMVLKELPTQIRHEVLQEMQEDIEQKQRLIVPALTLTTTQDDVNQFQPDKAAKDADGLFAKGSLQDVKQVLQEWIDTFPERIDPSQDDYYQQLVDANAHFQLELIVQLFDQMIRIDKNLEHVLLLLRFLRRRILAAQETRNDGEFWKWIFNEQILRNVQNVIMQEEYGTRLMINKI